MDDSEVKKKMKIEIDQDDSIEYFTQKEVADSGTETEEKKVIPEENLDQGKEITNRPEENEETGSSPTIETEEKTDLKEEELKRLKSKLQKKEAEIKNLRKEKDEWKDKCLRAMAEMHNARKRLEKEREEFIRFALSEFLKELLSVVDNFERALESRDESNGRPFQEGVTLIYRQLMDLLRKQGVKPVENRDNKFDPNVHQALVSEEVEGINEPEIAEILQKGYWLHDRLLRPALVKVLVPRKNQ